MIFEFLALKIYSRRAWGAKWPKEIPRRLNHPKFIQISDIPEYSECHSLVRILYF